MKNNVTYDVIIFGAGAAGLMCAIEAGKRKRSVLVLESEAHVGKKIRISGGGRCNFTNLNAEHDDYLSYNPHFCTSALARYTPQDFITLVQKHGIGYHEKKIGQLFCDRSAQDIIDILLRECGDVGVTILPDHRTNEIEHGGSFHIHTSHEVFTAQSIVIATGGLSIPRMGATDFGYRIAKRFGLNVVPTKPALVSMKWKEEDAALFANLTGVSLNVVVTCNKKQFHEDMLFTHHGLSGPAILQISSYWNEGDPISIDLLPWMEQGSLFMNSHVSKMVLGTYLSQYLPQRFVKTWLHFIPHNVALNRYSESDLRKIEEWLHAWIIHPAGTDGYDKAEVTCGGVDTNELSSKTMESKKIPGLYFIGEVVDVTGHLGGYNFQWAWSSGWAAGQFV